MRVDERKSIVLSTLQKTKVSDTPDVVAYNRVEFFLKYLEADIKVRKKRKLKKMTYSAFIHYCASLWEATKNLIPDEKENAKQKTYNYYNFTEKESNNK